MTARGEPAGVGERPDRPAANRRTAAVASATSTAGGEAAGSRVDAGADDPGLADQLAGEVVEMGRLLDDLATAFVDPAPPGRAAASVSQRATTSRGGRPAQAPRTSGSTSNPRRWYPTRHDQPARRSPPRAGPDRPRRPRPAASRRGTGRRAPTSRSHDRHRPVRRHAHRTPRRDAPPRASFDVGVRRAAPGVAASRRRSRRAATTPTSSVRPSRASASRWRPAIQPLPTRPSAGTAAVSRRSEDPRELERRRLLELVVAAVGRRLVRSPALEGRPVPEPVALEVVVGDLGDALGAERLPRQVLAPVPARGRAGQSLARRVGVAVAGPLGPFAPRVAVQRVLAQRRELLGQRRPLVPRERRRDPHVVELARRRRTAPAAATRRGCPARSCASGTRRRRSRPFAGA